ncbi:DUF418 domain-containing protein [Fictibacillus aquaticus]|uniref:DUF418 domain-containing protein n=1 Tax=Fictibacillus aquaticus TaxID=2021314 RepID=UPI0013FD422C|nr:DUF418 domain-containing protein [Fictibacillus aquaticus]
MRVKNSVLPVGEGERIEVLDVMRGIALLGILLVNMKSFAGPDTPISYLSYAYWNESYNVAATILLDFFVQGNFITMFSFLFGFGIIIMKERAEAKERRILPIFARRQIVLFLFGVLHVVLFWHGDILINYAGIGMIALLFIRRKPKTLFLTGIIILTLYSALMTAGNALYWATGEPVKTQKQDDAKYEAEIEEMINVYSDGTFTEIMAVRISEWQELNAFFIITAIALLPMFLFGMYSAKKRNLYTPKNLWRILAATFILGAGSKLLPVLFYSEKGKSGVYETTWIWGYEFGGAMMSLFYLSLIVLLYKTVNGKKLLSAFAAPGRMAFTIYLMQSVICTTIFNSYGLGLYGSIGPMTGAFLAAVIFSVQLIFAKWWIKRYTMGPLEWVWRTLTYGKVLKLKRDVSEKSSI